MKICEPYRLADGVYALIGVDEVLSEIETPSLLTPSLIEVLVLAEQAVGHARYASYFALRLTDEMWPLKMYALSTASSSMAPLVEIATSDFKADHDAPPSLKLRRWTKVGEVARTDLFPADLLAETAWGPS